MAGGQSARTLPRGGQADSHAPNEGLCETDDTREQICKVGVAACIANNPMLDWDDCLVGVVILICRQ